MLKGINFNPAFDQPTAGKSIDRDQTRISSATKEARDPKMLEAAQGFENQFIRQMISEMRKTVPKDELIPESMAEKIYRDQMDDEYADTWVKQGGIGLADIIYDQLNERYGNQVHAPAVKNGEFLHLDPSTRLRDQAAKNHLTGNQSATNRHSMGISELLSSKDGDEFLIKKVADGFHLKSRGPLKENVALHAPLSGLVLQAAATEDGRQLLVIKHDKGLVSQLLHSGQSRVKTGDNVMSGQILANLSPSANGEPSKVFFGLRKVSHAE